MIKTISNLNIELSVIDKEIERLNKHKSDILSSLNDYKEYFEKLDGIEERLFYKIFYEGKKPSKAVYEIADENYMKDIKPASESQIWKYYNNLIKNGVKLKQN